MNRFQSIRPPAGQQGVKPALTLNTVRSMLPLAMIYAIALATLTPRALSMSRKRSQSAYCNVKRWSYDSAHRLLMIKV